jgi:hypothetical protein
MNVVAIINELRRELERIDGLILALESLRSGRKRGRPPKALQALRSGIDADLSRVAQRAAAAVKDSASGSATPSKKGAGKRAPKKASKPKA